MPLTLNHIHSANRYALQFQDEFSSLFIIVTLQQVYYIIACVKSLRNGIYTLPLKKWSVG